MSIVVLGFISNETPPPKPMMFRARLRAFVSAAAGGSPAEGSNLSVVWTPGALTSEAQNERFRRRPRLKVPIFRPHMMSNSSLLLKLGSTALTFEMSPAPRFGVIWRRWIAQVPNRPSNRLLSTEPTARSTTAVPTPNVLPNSPYARFPAFASVEGYEYMFV
jgi:hypothetical protein